MIIRSANSGDLSRILEIYGAAKQSLRAMGIDQWQDGYPNADSVRTDIENGTGCVLVENGAVIATAAVYVGHETTYDRICGGSWRTDAPVYGIIHRIAVAPQAKNKGAASTGVTTTFGFVARFENLSLFRRIRSAPARSAIVSAFIIVLSMTISLVGLSNIIKYGYGYCGYLAIAIVVVPFLTAGVYKNRKYIKAHPACKGK